MSFLQAPWLEIQPIFHFESQTTRIKNAYHDNCIWAIEATLYIVIIMKLLHKLLSCSDHARILCDFFSSSLLVLFVSLEL